ncbi:MAG: zinc-ribbon domain-containing protein [Candidatus Helarchaeota archaeon]
MIVGFLFVYWFIMGLYYLVTHEKIGIEQEIYQIEPIMSKPSTRLSIPLEEAGKLYSDMIDIPIIDGDDSDNTSQLQINDDLHDTIRCKICGNSLPDDSKFCIYCGSKL